MGTEASAHLIARNAPNDITLGGAIDLFVNGAEVLSNVNERTYSRIGISLGGVASALKKWHYTTLSVRDVERKISEHLEKILEQVEKRRSEFKKNPDSGPEALVSDELVQVKDALNEVVRKLREEFSGREFREDEPQPLTNDIEDIESISVAFGALTAIALLCSEVGGVDNKFDTYKEDRHIWTRSFDCAIENLKKVIENLKAYHKAAPQVLREGEGQSSTSTTSHQNAPTTDQPSPGP